MQISEILNFHTILQSLLRGSLVLGVSILRLRAPLFYNIFHHFPNCICIIIVHIRRTKPGLSEL